MLIQYLWYSHSQTPRPALPRIGPCPACPSAGERQTPEGLAGRGRPRVWLLCLGGLDPGVGWGCSASAISGHTCASGFRAGSQGHTPLSYFTSSLATALELTPQPSKQTADGVNPHPSEGRSGRFNIKMSKRVHTQFGCNHQQRGVLMRAAPDNMYPPISGCATALIYTVHWECAGCTLA